VIPGGAVAKPFVTHHNALGLDIVPARSRRSYDLKRLVVAVSSALRAQPKLRNEGLSTATPRVPMLELYRLMRTTAT